MILAPSVIIMIDFLDNALSIKLIGVNVLIGDIFSLQNTNLYLPYKLYNTWF